LNGAIGCGGNKGTLSRKGTSKFVRQEQGGAPRIGIRTAKVNGKPFSQHKQKVCKQEGGPLAKKKHRSPLKEKTPR